MSEQTIWACGHYRPMWDDVNQQCPACKAEGAMIPSDAQALDVGAIKARLSIVTNKGSTHWEGCWHDHHRSHDGCAVALLLAHVEAQAREIASLAAQTELAERAFDAVTDHALAQKADLEAARNEVARLTAALAEARKERDEAEAKHGSA